jgi:hypothetical protein
MTIQVTKEPINLREKLNELETNKGLKGNEILQAETAQEVRSLIGAGRKNLIINGDMRVAQRGTSFTNPASGAYILDRWRAGIHTTAADGNYTQEADAPTAAEAGTNFVNCLKFTCTTIDTSTTATNRYYTRMHLEGQDIAHAGFGQAGVRYVTLSFWHKHTKTGTHSFGIQSGANNRHYAAEYTQTTSNTWEKATTTLPVDTTGTWATDTNTGLILYFATYLGANYQGTANTWEAGQGYGTANQVNNVDSTSNSMRFTGVQLELGSVATDFEHRSYGEELALCQRYYQRGISNGALGVSVHSTQATFGFRLPVEMRSEPTVSLISGTTLSCDMTHISGAVTWTPTEFRFKSKSGFTGYGAINSYGALGNPIEPKVDNIQADAEL